MIALLLNSTFWIILGTVVFTALVIYFCHKSQVFAHIAKIAGIFLGVALLGGSAIYSVYQVNGYYSAEGGIIGKITNTFKPNTVTANDFEIKVENIELQQEFEDIYIAEITINQEIKLENNKKYALFVNGAPTSCFASESNYIGGIYGYAFYGANNTLLLHDDLVIELALHKNYSLMFIYTMGGNTAVNYWNYYFNRNDFVVTIEEIDVSAINNSEEVTGVVPEYYTVSYCVDDEVVAKQIYHPNDTIALIVEEPEAPDSIHIFSGWSANGNTIDESYRVVGNVVIIATFIERNFYWIASSQNNSVVSYGSNIWTDGSNIYYSYGSSLQYVLDKTTNSWNQKTWNGQSDIYGVNVWTDGTNIYYSNNSNQYVLNKATNTWSSMTWNSDFVISGSYIWTDGTNIYYSNGSIQLVLDKVTKTWDAMTWNGLSSFAGLYVWTDGTNIYYSNNSNQYVLNKATNTWNSMSWNGLTNFVGSYIWTDGTNIYYSNNSNQYVLNKATNTWNTMTWRGLSNFSGLYVWTDGTNIYYSNRSEQFVFECR